MDGTDPDRGLAPELPRLVSSVQCLTVSDLYQAHCRPFHDMFELIVPQLSIIIPAVHIPHMLRRSPPEGVADDMPLPPVAHLQRGPM